MGKPPRDDELIPTLIGEAKKAVEHRGSHLQIIASAGSGKTETVSQRVASLIAEGVEPISIVAFTFTERAAKELKERIRKRVIYGAGEEIADKLGTMYVGTIHGFCFQLLSKYVGRFESYDVMDENQFAAFVQRQSNFLKVKDLDPGGKLFKGISAFRNNLEVIENEMLDANDMPENLKFSVLKFYEMLDQFRFLTFGQQIRRAVDVLTDEEIHEKVTNDIKYLIVDEYQDVNPAQEKLINLLAKPIGKAELVVVGDDDQAIYQWRGSTVENITTFADRYEGVSTYKLLENRRSRPQIVEIADQFAQSITGRLKKEMKPSRSDNGPALDIDSTHETEEDEVREIANSIKTLHERGYPYKTIAVLVRGKVAYPAILKAFDEFSIPVQPGGRTGLFEQQDADFLGRCMCWLVDYEWKTGRFTQILENVSLDSLATQAKNLYGISKKDWLNVEADLQKLKAKVGTDSRNILLVTETYNLLKSLKVSEWDAKDPIVGSRLGTIARFTNFIADYEVVQKRSRQNTEDTDAQTGASDQGKYYFQNLAQLLQNIAMHNYVDFEGEEDLISDSVELLTVHSAKGLEWNVVFLPSLTNKRFPSSFSGRPQNWLVPTHLFDRHRYEGTDADERRLFYVAITRAREWLSLSAHSKVRKQPGKISPYISEIEHAYKNKLDYPKPWVIDREDEIKDLQITYSEIAAYLECGHSYWLRNRLGFPPAIVEAIGYGKAIHHLMRAIAEETKRKGKPLKPIDVDRILAMDFFLPFANKTVATNYKESARKLVLKYMKDYAKDMERVWEVERPFELALPGVVVSGRADVILDKHEGKPDSLAIVDYKTGDAEQDFGLQLQVYALAGLKEGLEVNAAFVHNLKNQERESVDTSQKALDSAAETIIKAAADIKSRKFQAKPEKVKCGNCDVRAICKSGIKM